MVSFHCKTDCFVVLRLIHHINETSAKHLLFQPSVVATELPAVTSPTDGSPHYCAAYGGMRCSLNLLVMYSARICCLSAKSADTDERGSS